ncbi:MAG TPA: hypothetical protein VFQ88_02975 [Nevskiaceae bacterium]|nr:hypothetical protein [Nevskiaceae bacterium]
MQNEERVPAPSVREAAEEALRFIKTLRDNTAEGAIDLLTNNAGEDVEYRLELALAATPEGGV